MWLKTRKLNGLLAPLATVVGGEISSGQLEGSYEGYAVEAHPHSGYPIKYLSQGATQPAPVNMLRVRLSGVGGSQYWRCQSSASSYVQDLTSRFTAGSLLEAFKPGQFKFEGVDTLDESVAHMAEKLVNRLGMPLKANADPALQERLIAAGLFDELDALRFGAHPYLPKVQFMPSGRELTAQYMKSPAFARVQPRVDERLRAAGFADYESALEAKMPEAERENPGRLELEVEAGKAGAPSPEKFRELLERAVRIAGTNARVNTPDAGQ
jgi:hypothetical protein